MRRKAWASRLQSKPPRPVSGMKREVSMRKAFLSIVVVLICLSATGQQPSQQEKNKAVARSFFEQVLDQGHLDKYGDSHASDFVAHAGDHDASLAEDIAAAQEERRALPDMRVKVNQVVAERDLVCDILDRLGYQHRGRDGISCDWETNHGEWHDALSL